jgi:hypothetical protein
VRATIEDAMFSAYDTAWKHGVFRDDWAAWNNTNTLPAVKVYHMGGLGDGMENLHHLAAARHRVSPLLRVGR